MIEQLPVYIGIGILAVAMAIVTIWVEYVHRKYEKIIMDLLKKQKDQP